MGCKDALFLLLCGVLLVLSSRFSLDCRCSVLCVTCEGCLYLGLSSLCSHGGPAATSGHVRCGRGLQDPEVFNSADTIGCISVVTQKPPTERELIDSATTHGRYTSPLIRMLPQTQDKRHSRARLSQQIFYFILEQIFTSAPRKGCQTALISAPYTPMYSEP